MASLWRLKRQQFAFFSFAGLYNRGEGGIQSMYPCNRLSRNPSEWNIHQELHLPHLFLLTEIFLLKSISFIFPERIGLHFTERVIPLLHLESKKPFQKRSTFNYFLQNTDHLLCQIHLLHLEFHLQNANLMNDSHKDSVNRLHYVERA